MSLIFLSYSIYTYGPDEVAREHAFAHNPNVISYPIAQGVQDVSASTLSFFCSCFPHSFIVLGRLSLFQTQILSWNCSLPV